MTKTIRITEILDYDDGIRIFAARDPIGGHYIGDMIDTEGDYDRYAVVGVIPERLAAFRAGQVDLRALLLEMPGGEWYTVTLEGGIDDWRALIPQEESLAESGFLPEGGYFLEPEKPLNGEGIRRAQERGKPVTLTGRVDMLNLSVGEWRIITSQGVKTGKTIPGGFVLDRVQAGRYYHFHCVEVTELDPLWRERQVLYLAHPPTAFPGG